MSKYLVATGIVVFTQEAEDPHLALLAVKERIRKAGEGHPNIHDPERIGQSLVTALAAGRLNFVVMDWDRTALLCGERDGVYEQPVSRTLVSGVLRVSIPDNLFFKTDPES